MKKRVLLRTARIDDCLIWTGLVNNKKGQIAYKRLGKRYNWYVHRLWWVIHFGPIPYGYFVVQKCGNLLCLEPSHLDLRLSPVSLPPSTDQEEMELLHREKGIIPVDRNRRRKSLTDEEKFSRGCEKTDSCWVWKLENISWAKRFALGPCHKSPIRSSCGSDKCINPEHLVCAGCEKEKREAEKQIERERIRQERLSRPRLCARCNEREREKDDRSYCRDCRNEYGRDFYGRNREYNAERLATTKHQCRAKKLGLPPGHTTQEWREVVMQQEGRCNNPYCRKKCKLTRDHIVPMELGGTNEIDNIQGLCKHCNSNKRDIPWEEFLALEAVRVSSAA